MESGTLLPTAALDFHRPQRRAALDEDAGSGAERVELENPGRHQGRGQERVLRTDSSTRTCGMRQANRMGTIVSSDSPIAGLQVGAKFVGDPNAIAIGESVEADLFVANVTSQPIECSVALPHISHGWLFSVMDSNGSAIDLDGPFPLIHSPFPERRVIPFTLAPGEVSPITVDELPLRSRPSFATSRPHNGTSLGRAVLTWLAPRHGQSTAFTHS
jgi:hypothetical protein